MKRNIYRLVCLSAFLVAFGAAFAPPLASKRAVKGPLHLNGDVRGAMDQARQLMVEVQRHNWDHHQVDWHLTRLPDQDFDQDEPTRGHQFTSFYFAQPGSIYEGQVVFMSDLYVSRSLRVMPGAEGALNTEGFYIVGWRDGRVKQVPASEARRAKWKNGVVQTVFPGMSQYASDLPKAL